VEGRGKKEGHGGHGTQAGQDAYQGPGEDADKAKKEIDGLKGRLKTQDDVSKKIHD
jgi:hypothetical protein